MRLVTSNIEMMKQTMTAISTIIQYNDMHIIVSDEGVGLHGLNGGGQHIIQVEIPRSEFDDYDMGDGGIFHINGDDLADLVRIAKINDIIVLEIKDNKFLATVKNEQTTNETSFGLLGEDVDPNKRYRPKNIIGKIFASNVTMRADLLLQAIKTASFGDGEIVFTHSEEGLEIISENDALTKKNRAHISYHGENTSDILFLEEIVNKAGNMVSYAPIHTARYFLDNVKTLTKILKADDMVKISMFDSGPLRIVKNIGDTIIIMGFMPIINNVI